MTGWSVCWRPSLSLRHSGLEPESSQPKSLGRKDSLVAQTRVGWIRLKAGMTSPKQSMISITSTRVATTKNQPKKIGGGMTRRQSKRRRIRT